MTSVRFNADGSCVFVYEDGHVLLGLGQADTKRASHVEPTTDGGWQADMAPIGGHVLGATQTRGESLALEYEYINKHIINEGGLT